MKSAVNGNFGEIASVTDIIIEMCAGKTCNWENVNGMTTLNLS